MLLQFFTILRINTTATTVVPFCFQGQLWGRFTSTKTKFKCWISKSTHAGVFFNDGLSIRGFSVKIGFLNSFKKFSEK